MKNFSIIGAGNLGNHLIDALVNRGYTLKYIYKKSKTHQFDFALTDNLTQLVKQSDFIIISTQESKIRPVAESIAKTTDCSGKIFFHTANALTSAELSSLSQNGAYVASFSPLQTFPEFPSDLSTIIFSGTNFLAEGDKKALNLVQQIVKDLQANLIIVKPTEKIYFHAGAVISSNFFIGLLRLAENQLKKVTDTDPTSAKDINILLPLIKQTLKNVESKGINLSLTGPAKRKESEVIKKHLEILTEKEAEIYRLLSDYIKSSF